MEDTMDNITVKRDIDTLKALISNGSKEEALREAERYFGRYALVINRLYKEKDEDLKRMSVLLEDMKQMNKKNAELQEEIQDMHFDMAGADV